MADLVAIGYLDERTAAKAVDVTLLVGERIIEPDAVATIVRDREGRFRVTTCHRAAGGGAEWGMLWDFLFGLLFFVPVLGMAAQAGTDEEFGEQARDMLQPGTSALFLVVEEGASDKAVEVVAQFGGRVLRSSSRDLSDDVARDRVVFDQRRGSETVDAQVLSPERSVSLGGVKPWPKWMR